MEFPKTFLFGIFCLVALVSADLNDQKKAAIKTLDSYVSSINNLYEKTLSEVDSEVVIIQSTVKKVREFGAKISEIINYNTNRAAKSGVILANLMKSSSNVIKCIENVEKDAKTENSHFFSNDFSKHISMHVDSLEKGLSQKIEWWRGDVKRAKGYYMTYYKKDVEAIQNAKDEKTISNAVQDFKEITENMSPVITEIFRSMDKEHEVFVTSAWTCLTSLKRYEESHLDETTKAIQKCLPKFYKHEFLFNSKSF